MSPTAPGGQSLTSWGQDSHPRPLQHPGVRASPHRCGAHTRIPYSPQGSEPHPTGAGLTPTSPTAPGVKGLTPRVRGSQIPAGKTCQTRRSAAHIPAAELWLTERGQRTQSNRLANTTAIAWGKMTLKSEMGVRLAYPRDRQRGGRRFDGREGLRGEQNNPENSLRPSPVPAQKGGPGRPRSTHGFLRDGRVLGVAAGRQQRAPAERLGVPET